MALTDITIGVSLYDVSDGDVIFADNHNSNKTDINVLKSEGPLVLNLNTSVSNGARQTPVGMNNGNTVMPFLVASGTTTQWGPVCQVPVFVTDNWTRYFIDVEFMPFYWTKTGNISGTNYGVRASHRLTIQLQTPAGVLDLVKIVSGNTVAGSGETFFPAAPASTRMQFEIDILSVAPPSGTMEPCSVLFTQYIDFSAVPGVAYYTAGIGGYVTAGGGLWPGTQNLPSIHDYRGLKFCRIHQREPF